MAVRLFLRLAVAAGAALMLCGCLAMGVAGAVVGVAGAAVGATAKGAGMVVGAVIPDKKDKAER
ncbi:MAG: hypothetical protein JWQ29_1157 [Phenylobacterium sp.]|nr:hypothetical protein [Phenylobacterium sp.]